MKDLLPEFEMSKNKKKYLFIPHFKTVDVPLSLALHQNGRFKKWLWPRGTPWETVSFSHLPFIISEDWLFNFYNNSVCN